VTNLTLFGVFDKKANLVKEIDILVVFRKLTSHGRKFPPLIHTPLGTIVVHVCLTNISKKTSILKVSTVKAFYTVKNINLEVKHTVKNPMCLNMKEILNKFFYCSKPMEKVTPYCSFMVIGLRAA
jgi:hypothetical protein